MLQNYGGRLGPVMEKIFDFERSETFEIQLLTFSLQFSFYSHNFGDNLGRVLILISEF